MKAPSGLQRQIALSLAAMALGLMVLSVVGSYVFYALASTYAPGSISETWMPTRVELVWILATVAVALSVAVSVAVRLSRRILAPLNAVASSLRDVAQGDLRARATLEGPAIGETAQLVRDFNALAERLQDVTQEQQFWNAAVAHELRTPVTVLRGRLQGLADGVFAPDAALFDSLLRQVEGLVRLIEDLRVLSLDDSGHFDLDLRPALLCAELAEATEAFAARLDAGGFDLQVESAIRHPVLCDAVRIRQALMALLDNALAHATPGPLRVRALVQADTCILSVEDAGPGVPAELAGQVFEAFRRVDPSRSRASGGSGLGLAVVQAIARAHGGSAACLRTRTGGSEFRLQWPV